MKRLNPTSTATLNKMISLMVDGYFKIQTSKGYMHVSVEIIYSNDKYMIVSVTQYGEHERYFMADPKMCFIFNKTTRCYFPCYFKMDGIHGREEESITMEDGAIKDINIIMQMHHTIIANAWLENIKQIHKL